MLGVVGLQQVARKRSNGFSLGMGQRLGIAAALLGDPQVLLFDEPVNGLDPEGILWVRNLMKQLASEGRTVFVSSHLMSEMALTAEHLIVIGRGQLMADTSVKEFIAQNSVGFARVRTPEGDPGQREKLTSALHEAGGQVQPEEDGALRVSGLPLPQISDLAHRRTYGCGSCPRIRLPWRRRTCGSPRALWTSAPRWTSARVRNSSRLRRSSGCRWAPGRRWAGRPDGTGRTDGAPPEAMPGAGRTVPGSTRLRTRPVPVPGAEPNPYAAPPAQPWQGQPPQGPPPAARSPCRRPDRRTARSAAPLTLPGPTARTRPA